MTISLTGPLALPRHQRAAGRPVAGSTARARALVRQGPPDGQPRRPVRITTASAAGPGDVAGLPPARWCPAP